MIPKPLKLGSFTYVHPSNKEFVVIQEVKLLKFLQDYKQKFEGFLKDAND